MPYVSKAQERYFNEHRAELEAQGVNVDEWNTSSKGLLLPERLGPKKKSRKKQRGYSSY